MRRIEDKVAVCRCNEQQMPSYMAKLTLLGCRPELELIQPDKRPFMPEDKQGRMYMVYVDDDKVHIAKAALEGGYV